MDAMLTAKENETKEIFEKNLQLLSPWLKEMVLKISDEELWDRIEITYTKEGHPVCRYREGDKSFGIVSRQPDREAKIWCDNALNRDCQRRFPVRVRFRVFHIRNFQAKNGSYASLSLLNRTFFLF